MVEDTIVINVADANGGFVSIEATGSEICERPQFVELLTFKGQVLTEGNKLLWATASEYENDYFTVERSLDGDNFEKIGKVKGSGTTNLRKNYDLLDTEAPDGISYYRLLKTNYNGLTEVASRIIALERKTTYFGNIGAYPNPTDGPVVVDIDSNIKQEIVVEIYDVSGRLLQIDYFELMAGANRLNLSLNRFAAGTYYITVVSDGAFETIKMIKQ